MDKGIFFFRMYNIRDLKQQIINSMVCHPGGQRLLVQGRNGVIRMVDIATGSVIQWFRGCSTKYVCAQVNIVDICLANDDIFCYFENRNQNLIWRRMARVNYFISNAYFFHIFYFYCFF